MSMKNKGKTINLEIIEEKIKSYGLDMDINIYSVILGSLKGMNSIFKLKSKVDSLKIEYNVEFVNSLFDRLLRADFKIMLNSYKESLSNGIKLDENSYKCLFKVFKKNSRHDLIEIYFLEMLKAKLIPSTFTLMLVDKDPSTLVDIYEQNDLIKFEENRYSYTKLIRYCIFKEDFSSALKLYETFLNHGLWILAQLIILYLN